MTKINQQALLVWSLFTFALILRLMYVFYGPQLSSNVWSDMHGYVNKSDQILRGVWDENHFFQSIGYPLVIGMFKKLSSNWGLYLSLFQGALSFLTVVLTYKLATGFFGKQIGLMTLVVASIHLPWIAFSNLALPESIFTFLLSMLGWLSFKIVCSERPSILVSISWGITFIAAFWLKGTHVFLFPIFILCLLYFKQKQAIKIVSMIGLVVLIGLGTHGALAYQKIGKFQLSASTGGLNFIEGKCPSKKNRDSLGYSWLSPLYYQLGLHESKQWDKPFTDSSYYMKEGFKCIRKDPLVLLQSVESIPFLFFGNTLWPINQLQMARTSRLHELLFGVFVICGLIIYAVSLYQKTNRVSEISVWVLPVLSLFLCVYIFKSEVRYRIPFDVWFIPLGVKGWSTLLALSSEFNRALQNHFLLHER